MNPLLLLVLGLGVGYVLFVPPGAPMADLQDRRVVRPGMRPTDVTPAQASEFRRVLMHQLWRLGHAPAVPRTDAEIERAVRAFLASLPAERRVALGVADDEPAVALALDDAYRARFY